jgi:hypothetical protein
VIVHEKHSFAIRLTVTSIINSISWNFVVVYGPCWQPDLSNLIANCNMTIAFFDKLKQFRTLSHHEFKFRVIIKGQIQNLLAMQSTYWRQRYT